MTAQQQKENDKILHELFSWLEARGFESAVKEIKTTHSYEKLTGRNAAAAWKEMWNV